jgi:hypothetical protein
MKAPEPVEVEEATVNWGRSDYLANLKASLR